MPDKRRPASVAQLHELLSREFEKSAAGLCSSCRVPKPVFRRGDGRGPNWSVPPLGECDSLCHTILQDIAERLARDYELI